MGGGGIAEMSPLHPPHWCRGLQPALHPQLLPGRGVVEEERRLGGGHRATGEGWLRGTPGAVGPYNSPFPLAGVAPPPALLTLIAPSPPGKRFECSKHRGHFLPIPTYK